MTDTFISGDTQPFERQLTVCIGGIQSNYVIGNTDTVSARFATKDGNAITAVFACAVGTNGKAKITCPSVESVKLAEYDKQKVLLCVEVELDSDSTLKEFQLEYYIKKGLVP